MLAALLAVLAASPAACVTSCGLEAPDTPPAACRALQGAQDRILAAFAARVAGWTVERTCPLLRGWTVQIAKDADATGDFLRPDTAQHVLGLTYGTDRKVVLGLRQWGDSALAHELAHVISYGLEHDLTHDRWTKRGICAAINAASDRFRCDLDNPSLGWVESVSDGGETVGK